MYAGRPHGNNHGLPRLGAEHVARGSDELGQHQGGRRRGAGLEVITRRGDRALERRGQREAREPCLERLEPAAVILAGDGLRRERRLGRPHDEPQGEQPVAFGPACRRGGERDEPLFRRGSGRGHATRRSTAAATSTGARSARQRWWPRGQVAVPVAEQGRQSRSRCSTTAGARYGKKPNRSTVGPNSATTGAPTPVAMCMTPVSPDTTTRERASSAPVSWSENSPAALATAPPPSATSCCASPRSSGPPTMTGRYPAAPNRSARALQCATGQRLVAWAAPGASAASRAPASPRSASHCAARSVAPGPRQNSGGPPSGRVSRRRAASK